ncbi:microtubule-associated protein 10 [Hippocampus zosterae]|uniref:microtubule-associated protein 10 n=1 Tax=Hippocampus zosterae TaxID=109293 RepID=UPI00223CC052|nr:microtubule-associated protein 10 [Hippocampus zosterae]
MMSKQPGGNPKQQTLFSFELLVEYICFDCEKKISDEIAVGIRLLDFPTLLIYPPELRGDDTLQHDNNKRLVYSFNRGKSCFFEMNLDSLHTQLANTPVYVMILDVKDEIPKLFGTSLISLASIMDRIRRDSMEHDFTSCSSYGERGFVRVNNLAEEPVGVISLSYKLLTVGVSLPLRVTKKIPISREQCPQEGITKRANKINNSDCMRFQLSTQDSYDDGGVDMDKHAASTQTERVPISHIPHTVQEQRSFEEDLTVFCPPCLYYCNSGKEKHNAQENEYRLVEPDSTVLTQKDTFSENENSLEMDLLLQNTPKTSESVDPKVLEEALRPLPLLNALFVELSQLNVHNLQQQSVLNHPDLDWINKRDSLGASDGQVITPKTRPVQKSKVDHSLHSNHLHCPEIVSPKNFNAEHGGPMQKKQSDNIFESKEHRKKLVYKTTKTYNLRRQKNCTVVKHRDCMASHTANETQSSTSKGKKSDKRNGFIPKENMKKTQNMQVVTAVQGTPKVKHDDGSKLENPKQDRKTASISPPRVNDDDDDATINKLPKMILTRTKSKSQDVKLGSCKSSRHSSRGSLLSDTDKEEDYADDFNSFEASDADTTTSPKPAQSKPPFPHGFHTSDLDSEPFKEKPLLPSPMRGHSPVQRVLRGTHLIQPRTRDSALSCSSDENGAVSVQMRCSKKQANDDSSEATSAGGQKSENSSLVWRGSSDSICSDPLEAEELEDDLGSLDFRKEYQHISELVAFKLPGYTL